MIDIVKLRRVLFVSNMGEDTISVVDMDNRREIERIHLRAADYKSGEPGLYSSRRVVGPHSIKADRDYNIYSINCFGDSISVIDSNTYKVKESFLAGSHPNDMVFNTDESYAYVTNGDSDSISIIDISNKKIIAQVSVGVMPHGICISPDGEYIYVANMDSSSVSIIDTWSNSMVSCIKVGRCPIEVMTSKNGRYLYAVCSNLGSDRNGVVSVISTANFKVIKNIEIGMIPVQMMLSDDGCNLYVTHIGSNDMRIIDLKSFLVTKIIKTGKMTRGITSGPKGCIIVTNSEDNNVSIIDTKELEVIYNIGVGIEPTSMLYMEKANP